jgi:hypothetical protein
LKIESYVRLVERRHPGFDIPFKSYDGGQRISLATLITPLLGSTPVYTVGDLEEDLSTSFDLVNEGLVQKVEADGDAPDPLADLRADPHRIDELHPPARLYPPTTWEAAIAAHYADVPFKAGVALQQLGPQPDWKDVEALYRRAIAISPTLSSAYKNLGVLINTNAGPAADTIAAWTTYLELNPEDTEAPAIRAAIERLGGTPPPTPAP